MCIRDSDNSRQLMAAATELGWVPDPTTPHRLPHNPKCERAIRTTNDGTRAILLHAGFPPIWWGSAAEYFNVLWTITRESKMAGETKTAWEHRKGQPFTGKVMHFGSLVYFSPLYLGLEGRTSLQSAHDAGCHARVGAAAWQRV